MSAVKSFWCHEASNILCVRASDLDRVTAERDALQQLLNAADERADLLDADAARYCWLRDKSEATNQFYLSVPLWFTGVRFRSEDVDKAIDAMSKGESHDQPND